MSAEKPPRRPYSPPRIKTSKLYERNALACGKTPRGTSRNPRCGPRGPARVS